MNLSLEEQTVLANYKKVEAIYHPLYCFVFEYERYMKDEHNYRCSDGSLVKLNMIAMHTLLYIFQNPGCSPTDIAAHWGEDLKVPVSAILRNLTTASLIESQKASTLKARGVTPQPGQRKGLFCTPLGHGTALLHMEYDIEETKTTRETLLLRIQERQPDITMTDIERFFSIIPEYTKLVKGDFSH